MARTNRDRILDYLRSIAPRRATNSDIRVETGVEPLQQVFQITQKLRKSGTIQAARPGHEWEFWVEKPLQEPSDKPAPRTARREQCPAGLSEKLTFLIRLRNELQPGSCPQVAWLDN